LVAKLRNVGLIPYNKYRSVRDSKKMLWEVEPLNHQPHLKIKISPEMTLILIQCQMRRVRKMHQLISTGNMHLRLPPGAKRLPTPVKSSYRLPYR
jgi:hypothetical protein